MKRSFGSVTVLAGALVAALATLPILAADPAKPAGAAAEAKPAPAAVAKPQPAGKVPPLDDPSLHTAKAPENFKAKFDTTKGSFTIEVTRAWSPNGADRFYNLVRAGFFDGVKFFRVVPGFMAQFGINGDPKYAMKWLNAKIQDDPSKESNKRGYVTFAKSGQPNSRSTQLFINLVDNAFLDNQGFSPFGRVTEGMDVVDKLYGGYGEKTTSLQGEIATKGNAFLEEKFPQLDGIKTATIVP